MEWIKNEKLPTLTVLWLSKNCYIISMNFRACLRFSNGDFLKCTFKKRMVTCNCIFKWSITCIKTSWFIWWLRWFDHSLKVKSFEICFCTYDIFFLLNTNKYHLMEAEILIIIIKFKQSLLAIIFSRRINLATPRYTSLKVKHFAAVLTFFQWSLLKGKLALFICFLTSKIAMKTSPKMHQSQCGRKNEFKILFWRFERPV